MGTTQHSSKSAKATVISVISRAKSEQKTVQFINDEASSVHGSIRTSSVFTTESGEWKLGGLDVLSSMKEEDAVIYVSSLADFLPHAFMLINTDLWKPCPGFGTLCTARGSKGWLGQHQAEPVASS